MLFYYFKFALRNLRFHFSFSLINILGLSIGIASCLLIFTYLSQQWSYDTFHTDYENIYRVEQRWQKGERAQKGSATTISKVAQELEESYSMVEEVCRLHKSTGNISVKVGKQTFREENVMGTDESFFKIFHFPFVYGSASSALAVPQAVVLTRSTARKYFGDINPLGEEIIMEGAYGQWAEQGYQDRLSFQVAGVIEDLPENTHLTFDILVSFSMYSDPDRALSNWGDTFYTYVRLENKEDQGQLKADLPQIVQKYSPKQGITLSLQAMHEIHLTSHWVNEIKANGDEKILWLLSAVAVLILVLACTNYINFALAKSISRQKEMGIRKVFCANTSQLFRQLFCEALLCNVLALLLALTGIQVMAASLSGLMGMETSHLLTDPGNWLVIFTILLSAVLLTGLYPAFYLSRLRLPFIKKKQSVEALAQQNLRKGLVAFQFVLSMLAVGFALVLYSQMAFMQSKDLGMDMSQTLLIGAVEQGSELDSVYQQRRSSFQAELLQLSQVESVTQANFIPGREISGKALNYVRRTDVPEEKAANYYFTQLGFNFIDQMKLKLLAGRNFDPAQSDVSSSVIINKEACRSLGFASPQQAIGEQIIYRMDSRPTIIGVLDDFHQLSLQRAFQPIIFEASKEPSSYYYLKLYEKSKLSEIRILNQLWQKSFPNSPFSYFFLDDFYDRQYQDETNLSRIFTVFATLAILISSLGFFGMSYYAATQKIKEIGIRKTLGASFNNIIMLLGKESVSYLLISALIALPLILSMSERWLSYYAFRIQVSWWMVILPPILLLFIALVVIVHQSSRTYRLNPVETLKHE